MKSPALQELIKRIFSDENTRAEFISNPENLISKYPLEEHEKKALLITHSRLGLATGNSTQIETSIGPLDMWM